MPIRMWRHECPAGGGSYRQGKQTRCEKCGQLSVYDGWHLTMHEAMARHQASYGMKPMGPHFRRVHEVLGPLHARCETCSGQAILTDMSTDTWSVCPTCQGEGGYWTVPDEEVEAAREQILSEFPDAGASRPRNFLSGRWLALDLGSNTIVDLSEEQSARVNRLREELSD